MSGIIDVIGFLLVPVILFVVGSILFTFWQAILVTVGIIYLAHVIIETIRIIANTK